MQLLSDCDLDFAIQATIGACDSDAPNVAYGAQSCWGKLDRVPIQEAIGNSLERVGTLTTLMVRASALTGLVVDSAITVDDVSYTIRDVGPILSDGLRTLTLVVSV